MQIIETFTEEVWLFKIFIQIIEIEVIQLSL